jgi:hypothetical protein
MPMANPCTCDDWPLIVHASASHNIMTIFILQACLCNRRESLCAYQAPVSMNRPWELARVNQSLVRICLFRTAYSLLVAER